MLAYFFITMALGVVLIAIGMSPRLWRRGQDRRRLLRRLEELRRLR